MPTMLAPAKSPIHSLVSTWWASRKPQPSELAACRAALWTAATHEITANASAGILYDPLFDRRFLWASQWLDVAHGSRHSIDMDTCLIAATHFDPVRPADRKQLAAGS